MGKSFNIMRVSALVAVSASIGALGGCRPEPPRVEPQDPPIVEVPTPALALELTPVRVSPNGAFVAVGLPPGLVIELETGLASEPSDAFWVEGYLDPRSQRVVVWNIVTGAVSEHGHAVDVQSDGARVWAQRGAEGPYDSIAKGDLAETRVADVGANLEVHADYATLVIDGVFTIVSPRRIVFEEGFRDPLFRHVAPPWALFRESGMRLVNLDTGEIREMPFRTVALLSNRELLSLVDIDGTVLVADDLQSGGRRVLCRTDSQIDDTTDDLYACHYFRPRVVELYDMVTTEKVAVVERPGRFRVAPHARAYFTIEEGTFDVVFVDGTQRVAGGVEPNFVRFNDVGTAASIPRSRGMQLVTAAGAVSFESASKEVAVEIDLHQSLAVVRHAAEGAAVVTLATLEKTLTDELVQATAAPSGEVFTLETRPGETRPVLRLYRANESRVDVREGVDHILFADKGTSVVAVTDAVDDADNGVFVVHVDG